MAEKRTKIFYLITKSNLGGAQRYVYELATNLPASEYEVTVVAGGKGPLLTKLNQVGIKTLSLPYLGRDVSFLKDIKVLFKLIKLFRAEKPDVIHLNSSKIGVVGALAGRLAKVKKIIFTGHAWAFNEERSALSKAMITILHWLTIKLSHKTIAVSEGTKEQIEQLFFLKNKIVRIYNGAGNISFLNRTDARNFLWPNKPELNNKLIIGTVAELHKNKGLDYLIDAYAQIDNDQTALMIIGEGEERETLEKLIKEKALINKVFLLGHVDEARKYLKAFDIFTLTSRTEAFPYAILEAGEAGLPVIASYVGGIPEIIGYDRGILVKKGLIRELKYALNKLINSEEERQALGANLKKYVTKNFALDQMVKETAKLYNI